MVPAANVDEKMNDGTVKTGAHLVKKSELLTCLPLLDKAKEELKFCQDREVTPQILIKDCLEELETQGFLNLMEGESEEHMYQIKDQRDKLKEYISQLL